jgi:putative restriction endonuclease
MKRSPGSLTIKMLNLDGSRANSARLKPEIFLRLGREPDRYAFLYSGVIIAAREEGLADSDVPDFLGRLDDSGDVELLGQAEIGEREVETALSEKDDLVGRLRGTLHFNEIETMRLVEQQVRLGQHRFAKGVITSYEFQCGFCGFSPGDLKGCGLLTASHIKPWARSSARERLDARNGVAACPVHDAAFDAGLLTIENDLRIRLSPALMTQLRKDKGFERFFGTRGLFETLIVPSSGQRPATRFLKFHRQHVFARGTRTSDLHPHSKTSDGYR